MKGEGEDDDGDGSGDTNTTTATTKEELQYRGNDLVNCSFLALDAFGGSEIHLPLCTSLRRVFITNCQIRLADIISEFKTQRPRNANLSYFRVVEQCRRYFDRLIVFSLISSPRLNPSRFQFSVLILEFKQF